MGLVAVVNLKSSYRGEWPVSSSVEHPSLSHSCQGVSFTEDRDQGNFQGSLSITMIIGRPISIVYSFLRLNALAMPSILDSPRVIDPNSVGTVIPFLEIY